ncbi:hypothetical protein [Streptomyces sp. A1547]|uniref:hypothetical protein n=1 Tax=Streptomyces sp. A1547 TaxID=2563105 RepID=UPI00109E61D2|nr:hypothetical protein [Streptomyces sp. A1547]THA38265.1 hypothetical protein E6W17_17530 [Streptomyces sp. A1547]
MGWAGVLLLWALYNCFWQVGVVDFLQGIVYYGIGDGSGAAETFNLNWGVVYVAGGLLVLRGNTLGRGIIIGGAAIEGYNRVRSLTGALFDEKQTDYFTSTLQGGLKLATFAVGVLVTGALIVLLLRDFAAYEPWQPPVNPWTQQAHEARQAHEQAQRAAAQQVQQQPQFPQQQVPQAPQPPQPQHGFGPAPSYPAQPGSQVPQTGYAQPQPQQPQSRPQQPQSQPQQPQSQPQQPQPGYGPGPYGGRPAWPQQPQQPQQSPPQQQ